MDLGETIFVDEGLEDALEDAFDEVRDDFGVFGDFCKTMGSSFFGVSTDSRESENSLRSSKALVTSEKSSFAMRSVSMREPREEDSFDSDLDFLGG